MCDVGSRSMDPDFVNTSFRKCKILAYEQIILERKTYL
jgi:hypothetical protein